MDRDELKGIILPWLPVSCGGDGILKTVFDFFWTNVLERICV